MKLAHFEFSEGVISLRYFIDPLVVTTPKHPQSRGQITVIPRSEADRFICLIEAWYYAKSVFPSE
jgi:hypothetical protein